MVGRSDPRYPVHLAATNSNDASSSTVVNKPLPPDHLSCQNRPYTQADLSAGTAVFGGRFTDALFASGANGRDARPKCTRAKTRSDLLKHCPDVRMHVDENEAISNVIRVDFARDRTYVCNRFGHPGGLLLLHNSRVP
jgi:hypothetical protein